MTLYASMTSSKVEWVERCCPLCGPGAAARVFAESNIDLSRLDQFAFASRKLPEYMHPRLCECTHCHLLYGNPVLSQESISAGYNEAAFDSGMEAEQASRTYQKLIERILPLLPDRDAALDIGTGDGVFLERLMESGFSRVRGVEPSSAPIAAAKPHIRGLIQNGLFDPGAFEPASLSLITCFQTMEHVWDPLGVCRGAHRLLKKGGALVVVVHNRQAMSARVLGRKSPIFDIEHLQLFSIPSSRRLFELAGFSGVQAKPIWNRYPLHYWIKLFPFPPGAKRAAISLVKKVPFLKVPIPVPAGNLVVWGFRDE
ncbi:MAG TPA: class I SAM-dependent methyltransferase [Bryobacteraceae bacterium]|nr:class I SAM-dependent methyltransferase [Bryobacteraceae bacterium]